MVTGPDEYAVATICSVNVNGVLLAEGIPTTNRFGGLLQFIGGWLARFTQIINYDGTTLDPPGDLHQGADDLRAGRRPPG